MESKKFLRVGNTINFAPNISGLSYTLENGSVYSVLVDRYEGTVSLNLEPELQMPEKIYSSKEQDSFIDKVLTCFNNSKEGTTGVMLAGLKGAGKTVIAKQIALKSNLPIITIDKNTHPSYLIKLFNKLEEVPICVIFDEIDKIGEKYDDDGLLKIMDGINTSGKKLMLFTCNNDCDVNEYMKDRCSRVRYWKKFDETSASMIQNILEDKLDDKDEVKSLTDFIMSTFKCRSFDNIFSFVNEVNMYPNETYENLFNDMNLSKK